VGNAFLLARLLLMRTPGARSDWVLLRHSSVAALRPFARRSNAAAEV
jgi:hypothetical protein